MIKKSLASRLRRMIRQWRFPTNSRVIAGDEVGEEIQVDSLIYPLRYDIIMRAQFMAYYRQHRDVYAQDFECFLAHPIAQAYFTSWFSDASRSRPTLGSDRASLQSEFASRVRRAVRLIESLDSSGFNYLHPIELRAATIIRHEHDKHVQRRFYAGDGCHRLAFLASQGVTSLAPTHYSVRVFEEFRPRDNTYLLLGKVLQTQEQYCRIISKYYCDGSEYNEPERILEYVRENNPQQLAEVTSVIRVDLRRFAEMGVGSGETLLEE